MVFNFCYEVLRYNCNGLGTWISVHLIFALLIIFTGAVIVSCLSTFSTSSMSYLQLSGQNCLILSYKYHCLSADKPRGATRGGRSS